MLMYNVVIWLGNTVLIQLMTTCWGIRAIVPAISFCARKLALGDFPLIEGCFIYRTDIAGNLSFSPYQTGRHFSDDGGVEFGVWLLFRVNLFLASKKKLTSMSAMARA